MEELFFGIKTLHLQHLDDGTSRILWSSTTPKMMVPIEPFGHPFTVKKTAIYNCVHMGRKRVHKKVKEKKELEEVRFMVQNYSS